VRSYSTVRACLLDFIVRASHVRQHLGVVHRRAPSAHGVIERVLLQTEQHAGVVFMVLTAVYTQRAHGLSTIVAIWLGTYPVTYPAAVSASNASTAIATLIRCWTSPTRAWLRATRRRGASCQLLVTWHLNEWRRDAQHTRARSASVPGGPRGS
jgi:hypothetical protein